MTPDPPAKPPTEISTDQPGDATSVQIETCEKHGLRYNAAVDDGCARCRTEVGARTIAQRGFSPQRAPDITRGLLVAGVLVAGIGGSLFAAHTVAYHAARTLRDLALEETAEEAEENYEDEFEALFGDN